MRFGSRARETSMTSLFGGLDELKRSEVGWKTRRRHPPCAPPGLSDGLNSASARDPMFNNGISLSCCNANIIAGMLHLRLLVFGLRHLLAVHETTAAVSAGLQCLLGHV